MPTRGAYYLIIFGKNVSHEPYLLVIDSSNILQWRTGLSIAGVAENHVEGRIVVVNLYTFKGAVIGYFVE